jgi:hypothetical protein
MTPARRPSRPVALTAAPITKPEMISQTAAEAKPEKTRGAGCRPAISTDAKNSRLAKYPGTSAVAHRPSVTSTMASVMPPDGPSAAGETMAMVAAPRNTTTAMRWRSVNWSVVNMQKALLNRM